MTLWSEGQGSALCLSEEGKERVSDYCCWIDVPGKDVESCGTVGNGVGGSGVAGLTTSMAATSNLLALYPFCAVNAYVGKKHTT